MLKLFDYDVTLPIKLDPIEGPSIQIVNLTARQEIESKLTS
jgi:hypothetical protein